YSVVGFLCFFFFFQAEDGIRDFHVTGVQTCALPILAGLDYSLTAHARGFDLHIAGYSNRQGLLLNKVAESIRKAQFTPERFAIRDRKSVVYGKSGDLGGRRKREGQRKGKHKCR